MTLKKALDKQRTFIVLLTIMVLATSVLLLVNNKIYWQQIIDQHHFIITDYFFKYITWLGDGTLIAILSVLLVFYRIRIAIFCMSTFLISGLLAQLLKRLVFSDIHRPGFIFKQMGVDLQQVLDVGLKSHHSFPSGHTTTAFAFFFSLSLMLAFRSKAAQALLFLAAFLVGFSRIYLNLHFINDVLMGAILGVITTIPVYTYIMHFKQTWLEESLQSIIQKKQNHEKY